MRLTFETTQERERVYEEVQRTLYLQRQAQEEARRLLLQQQEEEDANAFKEFEERMRLTQEERVVFEKLSTDFLKGKISRINGRSYEESCQFVYEGQQKMIEMNQPDHVKTLSCQARLVLELGHTPFNQSRQSVLEGLVNSLENGKTSSKTLKHYRLIYMGKALVELGRYQEAGQFFEEARKNKANTQTFLVDLAELVLGQHYVPRDMRTSRCDYVKDLLNSLGGGVSGSARVVNRDETHKEVQPGHPAYVGSRSVIERLAVLRSALNGGTLLRLPNHAHRVGRVVSASSSSTSQINIPSDLEDDAEFETEGSNAPEMDDSDQSSSSQEPFFQQDLTFGVRRAVEDDFSGSQESSPEQTFSHSSSSFEGDIDRAKIAEMSARLKGEKTMRVSDKEIMSRELIELGQRTGDTYAQALGCVHLSTVLGIYRKNDEARDVCEKGLKIAQDNQYVSLEMGLYMNMSKISKHRSIEDSLFYLREILSRSLEENDIVFRAKALIDFVKISKTESVPLKLSSLKEALDIAVKTEDLSLQAQAHLASGRLYGEMLDRQNAFSSYHRALELGEKIKEFCVLYEAHMGLGITYDAINDYKNALQNYYNARGFAINIVNSPFVRIVDKVITRLKKRQNARSLGLDEPLNDSQSSGVSLRGGRPSRYNRDYGVGRSQGFAPYGPASSHHERGMRR